MKLQELVTGPAAKGGSGDSKEGDGSREEQGQSSRALFRCVLGSEKKRVPPRSLLWWPLVI